MDEILLFLLKKGAKDNAVKISTKDLGKVLSMSQQTASKKLIELETEGKITRTKTGVIITNNGLDELREVYSSLKNAFEGGKLKITGKIVEGFGEGGYYVSLEGYQKQFKSKVGFEAYSGTLNLKLKKEEMEKRFRLREIDPIVIEGWKTKSRSYGDIFLYKCRIENEQCALIIPVRTHHGFDILEIIAPFNVKDKLKKKNGDEIIIEVI